MKVFKKVLIMVLCVITTFCLCACGETPAEKVSKSLTNTTNELQKSISKLEISNQNELTSLSISPDVSEITTTTEPAKYYKSSLSSKLQTNGARANLENYILKLEEIYALNLEILNKNSAINNLQSELEQKFLKVNDLCQSIKNGVRIVNSSNVEYVNNCVKILKRTTKNLKNKKQYFNTAKKNFVSADLNNPEDTIIKGNTLLSEMDSIYVDLNFSSITLESIISYLGELDVVKTTT